MEEEERSEGRRWKCSSDKDDKGEDTKGGSDHEAVDEAQQLTHIMDKVRQFIQLASAEQPESESTIHHRNHRNHRQIRHLRPMDQLAIADGAEELAAFLSGRAEEVAVGLGLATRTSSWASRKEPGPKPS